MRGWDPPGLVATDTPGVWGGSWGRALPAVGAERRGSVFGARQGGGGGARCPGGVPANPTPPAPRRGGRPCRASERALLAPKAGAWGRGERRFSRPPPGRWWLCLGGGGARGGRGGLPALAAASPSPCPLCSGLKTADNERRLSSMPGIKSKEKL